MKRLDEERIYADRAARTFWPPESSDEYRESLGTSRAPDFTDVGKGRNLAVSVLGAYMLAVGALILAAKLGWLG